MASAVCLSGCAASRPVEASLPLASWNDAGFHGLRINFPHYRILTTVRDEALIRKLARVAESSYAQYAALVPPVNSLAQNAEPLEIVLFEKPEEWEAYTARLTGRDAPIYLSVGPGGYTYGDKVVCWLFNESDLWSVVAHEGFHQYVARNLPLRLPPALEEGLATTFETVRVSEQQMTLDRRANARRQTGLADAAKSGARLPLSTLVRGHAGDVAGREQVVREGFYAQSWALARMLLEDPKYTGRLQTLLSDLRDGRATPVVGRTGENTLYHPAAVQPLLMRYLGKDWATFESDYAAFCRSIIAATSGRD